MGYFTILKQPRLAALWISQVLSAFGDQLYLLATMWIAVQSFGPKAGFIAAANAIGRISFGLLGGVLADRLNRGRIMVLSDIVRCLAVATLPFAALHGGIGFWHLFAVSATIGTFGALFDPALQASLPSLISREGLQATNGLMDLTQRLARAISPSISGLLVTLWPLQQFFTIDAVSFLISAAAIAILGSYVNWNSEKLGIVSSVQTNRLSRMLDELAKGFRAVNEHKTLRFALWSSVLMSGLWNCAFLVGIPTLVKSHSLGGSATAGIGAYGLIVGAYGLGNVLSNVVQANIQLRRPRFTMFASQLVLGFGFLLLAFSHSLPLAMFAVTLAAIGGPMGELTLLNLIFKEIPPEHRGKTLSLKLVATYSGSSLGLIVAAPLYSVGPPAVIIGSCAATMLLIGIVGLMLYGNGDNLASIKRSRVCELESSTL